MTMTSKQIHRELSEQINNRYLYEHVKEAFADLTEYMMAEKANKFIEKLAIQMRTQGWISAKQLVAAARTWKDHLEHLEKEKTTPFPFRVNASPVALMFTRAAQGGVENRLFEAAPWTVIPGKVNDDLLVFHSGHGHVGAIIGGIFHGNEKLPAVMQQPLVEFLRRPSEHAKMHGVKTGRCSCCRRKLTDPISVENGIGPVCGRRWFPSSSS